MSTDEKDIVDESKKPKPKKKKKKKKVWGTPVVKKGDDYMKVEGKITNYENWTKLKDGTRNKITWEQTQNQLDAKSNQNSCLYITKCEDTDIFIPHKCARVALLKCKNCVLNVGTIINKIEFTNCDNTTLNVEEFCPIIQISKCPTSTINLSWGAALGAEEKNPCKLITEQSVTTTVTVKSKDKATETSHTMPNQIKATFDGDVGFSFEAVTDEIHEVNDWKEYKENKDEFSEELEDKTAVYQNWDRTKPISCDVEEGSIYIGNCKGTECFIRADTELLTVKDCNDKKPKLGITLEKNCKNIEIVNCKNVLVDSSQATGKIQLSGTEDADILLSRKAAGCGGDPIEVIWHMSSHCHVSVVRENPDPEILDYKETGLPDQICSMYTTSGSWEHEVEAK